MKKITFLPIHTENSISNLIKSHQIFIVIALLWLIRHQTEIRLRLNQSEMGKRNSNSVWFIQIQKIFLNVVHLPYKVVCCSTVCYSIMSDCGCSFTIINPCRVVVTMQVGNIGHIYFQCVFLKMKLVISFETIDNSIFLIFYWWILNLYSILCTYIYIYIY